MSYKWMIQLKEKRKGGRPKKRRLNKVPTRKREYLKNKGWMKPFLLIMNHQVKKIHLILGFFERSKGKMVDKGLPNSD